jgi:hypothetical protein
LTNISELFSNLKHCAQLSVSCVCVYVCIYGFDHALEFITSSSLESDVFWYKARCLGLELVFSLAKGEHIADHS